MADNVEDQTGSIRRLKRPEACVECNKAFEGPSRRGMCNPCRHRKAYHADVQASRQKAYKRAWYLKQRYGLDLEAYEALLESQGGVCAICGGDQPGTGRQRFHVDHDHSCCAGDKTCGECVRGLLCQKCNSALGMFNDDSERLSSALAYLGKGWVTYRR